MIGVAEFVGGMAIEVVFYPQIDRPGLCRGIVSDCPSEAVAAGEPVKASNMASKYIRRRIAGKFQNFTKVMLG